MKKHFLPLLFVMLSLLSSATAWGQVCKIGATSFATLEEALAYVNSYPEQEMTIIMLTDYTLPAGTYTLPAKATLVVPMSDEQETGFPNVEYISHNSAAPENTWEKDKPKKFRSLTFENGVNMNVYGTIELSGKLHASSDDYTSSPYGPYGLLDMNEGAKMTLMNGSELRAWGFVVGKGETDARRGSTVREIFQMGDWKGGSVSSMLLGSDKGVFPVTQYYIQNIESPVKYHPGAKLSTMAAVSANVGSLSVTAKADVAVIGVSGTKSMFLMDEEADQENTWVRKWYDTTKDQQVYEINSGASIGSIVIDLGDFIEGSDLEMNSSAFVLPLTNNMKIHLLSGVMDFTQNTALLPGAEVEINKESVVSITKNEDENVKSGSLYIYDADQWGKYAYAKDGNKYTKVVRYTPSANGQPTKRDADAKPADASINVHGTFDTKEGYIFTSESGANIYSSNEDAGTFVFTTEAKSIDYTEQVWQVNEEGVEEARTFISAKLINKDLTYTETAGTGKNMSYCYMNDRWNNLFYIDCYAANLNMATYIEEAQKKILGQAYDLGKAITQSYIKPREWVEITGTVVLDFDGTKSEEPYIVSVEGNSDHTFSDKDTGNRRFILMNNNCQWWEVEPVEGETGLFHCIHPFNDTYYYWDEENEEWAERRYTITWKNGDEVIDTYELPRGAMAEYLGTNPTKPMDEGQTYTFKGWTPALAPVTGNATYTADYKSTPRKYTVTLKSDVEGACSFAGAGVYDYNTTATISATMNSGYQFVGWEHDNTLGMSFITTVTGDVTYTVRTEPAATIIRDGLTVGQWGTLCPKQNVANPTGATFYQISYLEEKGGMPYNMYFDEVEGNLEAAQPYFFIASATEIKGIKSGEPKTEGSNVNGFYGYIGETSWALPYQASFDVTSDENTFVIWTNSVFRINAATNIKSERCYININSSEPSRMPAPAPVGARRITMGVSGVNGQNTATGVDQVQGDNVPTKMIINGQLFILRGEKMYDAQGKLVK